MSINRKWTLIDCQTRFHRHQGFICKLYTAVLPTSKPTGLKDGLFFLLRIWSPTIELKRNKNFFLLCWKTNDTFQLFVQIDLDRMGIQIVLGGRLYVMTQLTTSISVINVQSRVTAVHLLLRVINYHQSVSVKIGYHADRFRYNMH